MSRDLYVPSAFIEALGWATIRRYEFEHAVNILMAAIAIEESIGPIPAGDHALDAKLIFLAGFGPAAHLKHVHWRTLRSIGNDGAKLTREYSKAAFGAMYSRGFGCLEETMRALTLSANLAPPSPGVTPSKVNDLAEQFTNLTRDASNVASVLLRLAEEEAAED